MGIFWGNLRKNFSFSAYFNLSEHMKLWEEKRGSPRGELAPARATERGTAVYRLTFEFRLKKIRTQRLFAGNRYAYE